MGSHPRTRGLFDFSRQDCDVWVFNEAARQDWVKRVDGVLQLHIPTIWRNPTNRNDPQHYQWLQTTQTPVYMQEKYDDVPASVKFPKDEILSMLPNATVNGRPIREVSCSPAWALAYGIYLGYKRIEVYGVELESGTEYAYQQGNWKFWVGVAAGRGIELVLHTTMFDNPLYGYEGEVYLEDGVFDERLAQLAPAEQQARGEFTATITELWQVFEKLNGADITAELMPHVQRTVDSVGKLGQVAGAVIENQRYKAKSEAMKQQTNDFVFSRQEFEQGTAAATKKLGELVEQSAVIKGQLQMYHDAVLKAAKNSPKRKKAMDVYKIVLDGFIQSNFAIGQMAGARQENENYMRRLDKGIKAAGGVKSEQAILEAK